MNKRIYKLFVLAIIGMLSSCGTDVLPKPKGMLRLSYPTPQYNSHRLDCPYSFEKNEIATFQKAKRNKKCWYNIDYPGLNATVFISYFEIKNNLDSLLRDAQNLTQEHVVKADAIQLKDFTYPEKKVYGRVYEISGNAASQSQFYATDSINHFVLGSVYFKVKPNYDSILPAADYLRNDIQHLMETIIWK